MKDFVYKTIEDLREDAQKAKRSNKPTLYFQDADEIEEYTRLADKIDGPSKTKLERTMNEYRRAYWALVGLDDDRVSPFVDELRELTVNACEQFETELIEILGYSEDDARSITSNLFFLCSLTED